MQSSHLTLPTVLKRLQLRDDDVVGVFLVGSRLWGSATYNSDYDFIVVHRNAKMSPHATLHNGEIDASALHLVEFQKRVVEEHKFYELLCLWLPQEYRWKESNESAKSNSPLTVSLRNSFHLQPRTLFQSIDEETARDWRMAQKYVQKGNVERGKKTIVHAFRLMLLATQLIRDGKLWDFHAAQHYYEQMRAEFACDWAHYAACYRPKFDELRSELLRLCVEPKKRIKNK